MKTKILWVSRHLPLPSQVEALKQLFGEIDIRTDADPFANAHEIKNRMEQGQFQELVLIAPLSVCKELTELGVKPLWSEMRKVDCNSTEVEVQASGNRERYSGTKRCLKFNRFRRLVGIDYRFEDF